MWTVHTMNVGARGEGGVLGEGHGDVAVSAIHIVVFLWEEHS